MFPVFSLVLDKDVTDQIALTYPELYKELTKGRSLSYKTFFVWCLISIYQGADHCQFFFFVCVCVFPFIFKFFPPSSVLLLLLLLLLLLPPPPPPSS